MEKAETKVISQKTMEFELSRFFLALSKAMDVPQLLPYMKRQIFDKTEENYNSLTDEEVTEWLKRR